MWLALVCVLAAPASAHFKLNTSIRIVHVERLADGVRLYFRLPAPLVLAGAAEEVRPFVRSEERAGQSVHFIDVDAVRRSPLALGQMLVDGHRLAVNGNALAPRVERVRVHPATEQPRFARLEDAQTALDGPAYSASDAAVYVGDAVIDVTAFYQTVRADDALALSSSLAPGIIGEEGLANLVLDHGQGERTEVHRVNGLLREPVTVGASALCAASTFVKLGVEHILTGLDHVLFVLCLTIGALSISSLLLRVTGFTLGHSITLIAGFFGFVPSSPLFIPAVEAAIAVSIIYAALAALHKGSARGVLVITAAIGLLHGFGFSFVLSELLSPDAPALVTSLVSFNVGVELGQAAVVFAVWPLLHVVDLRSLPIANRARAAIAFVCIGVACLWTGQRLASLAQQLLV